MVETGALGAFAVAVKLDDVQELREADFAVLIVVGGMIGGEGDNLAVAEGRIRRKTVLGPVGDLVAAGATGAEAVL